MTRTVLVVWMVACASAEHEARESCDALLACASIVNPFLVRDFDAAYGEEGVCWETSDEPALCEEACEQGLVGLWIEFEHPEGCDPSTFVEPGSLTVEQFFSEFDRRYCEAVETCNPGRGYCREYYGGYAAENCRGYDPVAADLCLATDFGCDDRYGYGYPVAPTACDGVCD